MTTVQFHITRGSVVVRLPANAFAMSVPNEMTIRDKQIVGVGDFGVRGTGEYADPGLVTKPGFDAADFDPDLANAFTRWAFTQAMNRSGLGWRHRFTVPDLELDWPAWGSIPRDRCLGYLTACRTFRVNINGRSAIHPRVDVPLLRGLLGSWINPDL